MSGTHFQGPVYLGYRSGSLVAGAPAGLNPEVGPNPFHIGMALLDPRVPFTFQPGQGFGVKNYVFVSGGRFLCVDQAPSAISAVNLAASQSPGAGAITLVSATGAGITAGVSITRPDTGATVTGLLAIDGAMGSVAFGAAATIQAWDPTKAISRNLRLTSGGNDSGLTFTVNGYDLFGFPMTEAITGANAGIASGKKAFKYIASVTHTGSVATTLTIGTGDVFGFPLRIDRFAYADITWNSGGISANTGFVAADTTSPATTTTGDVRGTYAVQSASDGTKQLQAFISIPVANIAVAGDVGLFGVTQV